MKYNCRERFHSRPVGKIGFDVWFRVGTISNCGLGVLGKPLSALFLSHDNVNDRLPAVLEGFEIDLDVGRQKHFGIPGETLACRNVGNLKEAMVSTELLVLPTPSLSREIKDKGLTSRGGPSGSPMLTVWASDCERAEPT